MLLLPAPVETSNVNLCLFLFFLYILYRCILECWTDQIISDPVIRADRTELVAPSLFAATTEQCLGLVLDHFFMSTPAKTSLKQFYVLTHVTGEPGLNQKGMLIDFMFCMK